jgi:hypothetical protein
LGTQEALVEELLPVLGRMLLQALQVMAHFQQIATAWTAVDDLLQTMLLGATSDTLKPGAITCGRGCCSGYG